MGLIRPGRLLNGQHPNIKFTTEHEKEYKLAFLGTCDQKWDQSVHGGLLQAHPHRQLHPFPLAPPPENHHRGAEMYA